MCDGGWVLSVTMILCDSFVIAEWADPGTHPGRPIAGLHGDGFGDVARIHACRSSTGEARSPFSRIRPTGRRTRSRWTTAAGTYLPALSLLVRELPPGWALRAYWVGDSCEEERAVRA